MSLGIAFKGPEGIVLAADSRVTLNAQIQIANGPEMLLPATFDNATKLLRVKGQDYVGTITYGTGAIGTGPEPRTAHSFIPEFEAELGNTPGRLSVQVFAERLSAFFMARWTGMGMPTPAPPGQDIIFLVGGYDEGAPYGKVFEIFVPSRPTPRETLPAGQFGLTFGGQQEIVSRLINGFDIQAPQVVRGFLSVPFAAGQGPDPLEIEMRTKFAAKIPWQFLPLQDCVDLSIFLVRATITLQKWTVDIRGVGGAVDVATITRTKGFSHIQQKEIIGEELK
jgi:hypothetical protein